LPSGHINKELLLEGLDRGYPHVGAAEPDSIHLDPADIKGSTAPHVSGPNGSWHIGDALLVISGAPQPLTDLKMNLVVVPDELALKDFYGKVIANRYNCRIITEMESFLKPT